MILEEFRLGVCFTLEGTKEALRRSTIGNKTRLGDDGIFYYTDREMKKIVQ